MKKIYNVSIIVVAIILATYTGISQSLRIDRVITKYYPKIYAEVVYTDAAGDETIVPIDFINVAKLTDGGKNQKITKVKCQDATPKFSLILTIDATGSMNIEDITGPNGRKIPRWVAARNAAHKAIDANPSKECAMAVNSFAKFNELNQDFTTDALLLKKAVDNIHYQGPTDHNMGFIGDERNVNSALDLAERAVKEYCPPAVIFLTDGEHDINNGELKGAEIAEEANRLKTPFFIVTLGLPMPDELRDIANASGGEAFPGVYTDDELTLVFENILQKVKALIKPKGCDVWWNAECDGGTVEVEYNGLKASYTYTVHDSLKPEAKFIPNNIEFLNLGKGASKDTVVKIVALKNNIVLKGKEFSSNPRFSVINWGGYKVPGDTLHRNDTLTATIRYTSPDSLFLRDTIQLNSSNCYFRPLIAENAYIIAKDIDMGYQELNKNKSESKQLICNYTSHEIVIESAMKIEGGQAGEFLPAPAVTATRIGAGECRNFAFNFKPVQTGLRTADIKFRAGGINFSKKIFGNGSGQPDLTSVGEYVWENTNCKTSVRDTLINITNIGAAQLQVTSITITPGTSFSLVDAADAGPFTIDAGITRPIKVRFSTSVAGLKTETMQIVNNGVSGNKSIILKGTMDDASFTVTPSTYDIGVVCPGADTTMEFNVNNTGTISVDFALNLTPPFSSAQSTFTVAKGGTQKIVIKFSPTSEGVFTQKIKVKDALCGVEKEITITGEAETPSISGGPIVSKTTIGKADTIQVMVTLKSKIPVQVTASPGDASIRITSPSVFPYNAKANESFPLTIIFNPTNASPVNSFVRLTTIPCGNSNDIVFNGTSDKATATIQAESKSGLIGETVDIKIDLLDKVQVAESKATGINTTISFSSNLLEPIPLAGTISGGIRTINLNNLAINGSPLYTLKVKVLKSSESSTPIDIKSTQAVGGVIDIKETDGLLTVKPASAKLIAGSIKAEPGQTVKLPIYLEGMTNVDKFHESIKGELKYNSSLIQPNEGTQAGTVANHERTVPFEFSLTDKNLTGRVLLGELNFKAMLGDAENTQITLGNCESKTGYVDFDLQNGEFTLLGVCKDGNTIRLFNPYGNTLTLEANPNPAAEKILINYSVRESGHVKMWLSDELGAKAAELIDGEIAEGTHNIEFDASQLNQGAYILMLETRLGARSIRINILK